MTPPTDSEMVVADSFDFYLVLALALLAIGGVLGELWKPGTLGLAQVWMLFIIAVLINRLNSKLARVLFRRTKSRKLQTLYAATHPSEE